MERDFFVVVDRDCFRKNEVYRILSTRGYAFPVESPSEVEPYWPRDAWVIVHDDPVLLESVMGHMHSAGVYHPIIAYGQTSLSRVSSLFNQGVMGYVAWPDSDQTFLEQLEQCMLDSTPRVNQMRASSEAMHRVRSLSLRESQVIARMSEGLSNKEIARSLAISPRTVEIHRANALAKLGVDNSIAAAVQFTLARFGQQADGWVAPDPALATNGEIMQQAMRA